MTVPASSLCCIDLSDEIVTSSYAAATTEINTSNFITTSIKFVLLTWLGLVDGSVWVRLCNPTEMTTSLFRGSLSQINFVLLTLFTRIATKAES